MSQETMQGVLCMQKPAEFTSFDVIGKLRGILHMRRLGHTGTLDPMATGVLPVLVGKAARACDILPDQSKMYRATVQFGWETDTEDVWGTRTAVYPEMHVTKEALDAVLPQFVGAIQQVPPMYSAVSVEGTRLYELARRGVVIERPARTVQVDSIVLEAWDEDKQTAELSVACGKGTYIRTLLEDIAAAMGQKGTMSALRRTSAGVYTEADAHTLEEILAAKEQGMDALEALMLPVESVFESLPLLVVEPWVEQHLYNGCPTSRYPAADGRYRVRNAAGQFLGLANIVQGVLRVEKLFVERN